MIIPEHKKIGPLLVDNTLEARRYWHGQIEDIRRSGEGHGGGDQGSLFSVLAGCLFDTSYLYQMWVRIAWFYNADDIRELSHKLAKSL
jgi:hypothetical protein